MPREFQIPTFYRSPIISTIKKGRKIQDRYKKDLTPTVLDLGKVRFKIARHFGFCYGVENAIEIAYKAIDENPGKRIFLLSEMIHNPHVNGDLQERGVKFLMQTDGKQLIPFEELVADDIVIIPAFGTTVELFDTLAKRGIDPQTYNTTCPFVEKVWNRSEQIGLSGFTTIIHGRAKHEETRATFSHAKESAASLIIEDMSEAERLAKYIRGELPFETFNQDFKNRTSANFDPSIHLSKIGVVNQTTMLATETQAISEYLRKTIQDVYGEASLADHFADTRDTLCYATWENQSALYAMLESKGDVAIIVGGYNSSNTSHLVELCEKQLPTFYIKDEGELIDSLTIRHLDMHQNKVIQSQNWMPEKDSVEVLLSAGASCPDALVDRVIARLASLFQVEDRLSLSLENFEKEVNPTGAAL